MVSRRTIHIPLIRVPLGNTEGLFTELEKLGGGFGGSKVNTGSKLFNFIGLWRNFGERRVLHGLRKLLKEGPFPGKGRPTGDFPLILGFQEGFGTSFHLGEFSWRKGGIISNVCKPQLRALIFYFKGV